MVGTASTQTRWRHFVNDTELNAILDCAIPAHTVTRRPLVGIPTFQHRRLQSVLNAAARLILRSSHHDHVTHLLRDPPLGWECIDFRLAVLVLRCLCIIAPPYLSLIISNVSPATITDDFVRHHRCY